MAEHKRILGGVDPEDNVAKTLVINESMKEIRNYLARGRHFSNLDIDALNDYWFTSYHGFIHNRDRTHERDYHDLTAEFELRKIALPYDQVKHIFDVHLAEIKGKLESESTSSSSELEKKVEELLALALDCYNKPNNVEKPFKKTLRMRSDRFDE